MGLLKNLIKGFSEDKQEFKQKYKEAETQMKIEKMLQERQKSSNEREVERYMKEKREEQIKRELDVIRKRQTKENWNPKNKILGGKTTMLKDDRPILKEKNIFMDNKNKIPFLKQEGMFFE